MGKKKFFDLKSEAFPCRLEGHKINFFFGFGGKMANDKQNCSFFFQKKANIKIQAGTTYNYQLQLQNVFFFKIIIIITNKLHIYVIDVANSQT